MVRRLVRADLTLMSSDGCPLLDQIDELLDEVSEAEVDLVSLERSLEPELCDPDPRA